MQGWHLPACMHIAFIDNARLTLFNIMWVWHLLALCKVIPFNIMRNYSPALYKVIPFSKVQGCPSAPYKVTLFSVTIIAYDYHEQYKVSL